MQILIVGFFLLLVLFFASIRWLIEWTQTEIGFLIQLVLPHTVVHVPGIIAFLLLLFSAGQVLWIDFFTWCFRCIVGY